LTPHCGAEIRGIDLAKPLDDAVIRQIERALAEHAVVFFRDQTLTPEQQKAFGRRFGELHIHPAYPDILEGHPEIMVIRADENSTRIAGEDWHSDVSCDPEPPMGSILHMHEVPPVGGDTLFASMYAAYDALSAPLKRMLEGMTAIHDGEHVYRGRYGRNDDAGKTYPKALFVNRIFTTRIVQLSPHESSGLLAMLFTHAEMPEFQCRFRWHPGSIAFWDNRCAQHHAMWDYYPHRRRGYRVTIKGDKPC
jgi:taurine dioxygenase